MLHHPPYTQPTAQQVLIPSQTGLDQEDSNEFPVNIGRTTRTFQENLAGLQENLVQNTLLDMPPLQR